MASFEQATAARTAVERDKPTTDRSGDTAARSTVDREKPTTDRTVDVGTRQTADREKPVLDRPGHTTVRLTEDTILIPGDFRDVDVEIVNQDGERIEQAVWLVTTELFPTATRITDGAGTLSLLRTTYSKFMVVGDREGGTVDYAWINQARAAEPIGPQDESGTIVVDPERIAGLYAGRGTDFGGMLG